MTLPDYLNHQSPTGLIQNQIIAQYEIGNYKNFVYLILDWNQRKAAWVDPQAELKQPLNDLKKYGFELERILLTHTHFDHVAGLSELAALYPDAEICLNSGDLHRLQGLKKFRSLKDQEQIQVGDIKIEILHTSGHSAGALCYWIQSTPSYLLSGDTLFIRDCGRTDLETGNNDEMFLSLQKIRKLPRDTVILPGHHYQPECASLLETELRSSPPFQCKNAEELAQLP